MTGRSYRRVSIALTVAASLAWMAGPASAEDASGKDKKGDAAQESLDITSVSVGYTDGTISVGLLVPKGAAPTSAAWKTGDIAAAWPLVIGDKEAFRVVLTADEQGPVSGVINMTTKKVACAAEPGFQEQTYSASFDAGCINGPNSLSAAGATIVAEGEALTVADQAPDKGTVGPVTETCSSGERQGGNEEGPCQPNPGSEPRSNNAGNRAPADSRYAGTDGPVGPPCPSNAPHCQPSETPEDCPPPPPPPKCDKPGDCPPPPPPPPRTAMQPG